MLWSFIYHVIICLKTIMAHKHPSVFLMRIVLLHRWNIKKSWVISVQGKSELDIFWVAGNSYLMLVACPALVSLWSTACCITVIITTTTNLLLLLFLTLSFQHSPDGLFHLRRSPPIIITVFQNLEYLQVVVRNWWFFLVSCIRYVHIN